MSGTIDELTIAFSEDGVEMTKELGKEVLSKGAWTTILFCYKEWSHAKDAYGPIKYAIRRYKKRNNEYLLQSKFNISSEEQARKIIETLNHWLQTMTD